METDKKITIKSENDALNTLELLLNGELKISSVNDVKLDGWPTVNIRYASKNGELNSNITSKMASAVVELQTAIDRVHAYQLKGKANAAYLTDDEKKDVQLLVKVSEGSSHLTTDFFKWLEATTIQALKNLSPTETMILILGLALIAAGASVWKAKYDLKEKTNTSEEETKRTQIITDAMNKNAQILKPASRDFNEAHTEFIKGGIGIADTIEWQGESFTEEEAKDLVAPERAKSEPARLDDFYKITKYDRSKETEPKLYLIGVFNDASFNAALPLSLLNNQKTNKILSESMLDHGVIKCKINANVLRGSIHNAEIYGIEELTNEDKRNLLLD